MARLTRSISTKSTTIGNENFQDGTDNDPVNASTTVADKATLTTADTLALTTDKTTVDGNIATLVADGASPTQAHVTTLNTNWTTMKTDMVALHNAIVALQADIAGVPARTDLVVSVDLAKITSISSLRAAFNVLLLSFQGSNAMTL